MFLPDLFRSFLPLQNPIGFGAGDFIELFLAALLALFILTRSWVAPHVERFASRTGWCMLLLAIMPVALRLLLLPGHPVPTPDIYDEFSHLLAADTLRHFRLANPPHALPQFFETFFVLQEPSYSSIYPVGQGLILAIGWTIFGLPWAGVLMSVGAFCALCYWMLRAWTRPVWSLLGGLIAVIEFGPLNQWTNSYWGGAVPAAAGCLVFGALPRLRVDPRLRDAVLLGLGLGIHWLTRPFETIFLALSVTLFFLPALRRREEVRRLGKFAAIVALAALPAIAITLLHDKRVTGSWLTMPEVLSEYQYGVPAALTIQEPFVPHRELTPQQALDYRMQRGFQGQNPETLETFLLRLEYRARFYRFFLLPPLYVALLAFLVTIREYRFLWAALTLALFALGVNFFPAFQFHYIAACACLFVLVSVTGLERLSRWTIRGFPVGAQASWLLVMLCFAHFVFWYGLHLFERADFALAMLRYETWDSINHRNPERRILVTRELAQTPGKLLVFVRYSPQHIFQDEWVYNGADIDNSRIVWARDLGADEDEQLRRYYPDRAAWLLEPDNRPPALTRMAP
jgi:hypothetical protein